MQDTVANQERNAPTRDAPGGYGRRRTLVNATTLALAALAAPTARGLKKWPAQRRH
jgi:hypothetical protein